MSTLLHIEEQSMTIGTQAFKFPTISIVKGELVGLIGQSGSGKSILLRQLAGIMDTTSPLKFHGERQAFIFGRGGLFQHYTVRDNLKMALLFTKLSTPDEQIDATLKEWNLWNIRDRFPTQLNPQANKVVQIARTILLEPDILFIEKPLASMSMVQIDQFIQWIETHLKANRSIVYSEENRRIFHKMNPRIIDLDGGHDNLRTVMNG